MSFVALLLVIIVGLVLFFAVTMLIDSSNEMSKRNMTNIPIFPPTSLKLPKYWWVFPLAVLVVITLVQIY